MSSGSRGLVPRHYFGVEVASVPVAERGAIGLLSLAGDEIAGVEDTAVTDGELVAEIAVDAVSALRSAVGAGEGVAPL